jgi:hypothetical protein
MKSKNITIKINCDNAAFENTGYEVARILRRLAQSFEDFDTYRFDGLYDFNGNKVGSVKLTGF